MGNRQMAVRATGKNLLLPGRFSFMIAKEIPGEEVILVNRPLKFTSLKS
jgi:hypothetical protein